MKFPIIEKGIHLCQINYALDIFSNKGMLTERPVFIGSEGVCDIEKRLTNMEGWSATSVQVDN